MRQVSSVFGYQQTSLAAVSEDIFDTSSANAEGDMNSIILIIKYILRAFICGTASMLVAVTLPETGLAQEYGDASKNNLSIAYPSDSRGSVELLSRNTGTTRGSTPDGEQVKQPYSQNRTMDKEVVRDFALFNYSRLSNDIVNGRGLYLDTLFSLLGIEESNRTALKQEFMKILIYRRRIPEFAADISEYEQRK
jgi:hypothetical protein